MLPPYATQNQEQALHHGHHFTYPDDNASYCECESVPTVQAVYDYETPGAYVVRLDADSTDTYHSKAIYLTPNAARALAAMLCFAANDAETIATREAELDKILGH